MSRLAFVLTGVLLASDVSAQPVVRLTVADAVSRAHETSHRLAEIRAREQGAQAAIRSAELAKMPEDVALQMVGAHMLEHAAIDEVHVEKK